MIKENAAVFRKIIIACDLCVIAISFFLGYFLRNMIYEIFPLRDYLPFLSIVLLIWWSLLYRFGMYKSFRVKKLRKILSIVLKTAFIGFVVFGGITYIFKIEDISRTFIMFTFSLTAIFIILEKIGLVLFFRSIRKKGLNFRSILIVGTGKRAQSFIDLIHSHDEWGLKVIGLVDEDSGKTGEEIKGYKVLGSFKDVPEIIYNNVVDEVVFVVPRSWLNKIEEVMHFCEVVGVNVSLAVNYFELKFSKAKQTEIYGFPLLTFESTPEGLGSLVVKRLFDIISSITLLMLLAPLFISIALIVKITSKGPVFFRQQRSGLNGRIFTLYKFRTMVNDAETKLDDLLKYNELEGPAFKMEHDPRRTKVGRFLRKFSIDELPQLWNVFKGDMSVVGPRPPLPKEVRNYDNWHRRRLSMRPGITCLWQVNGRNKIINFDQWIKLDLEYIDNWSLWRDVKILFKTIPVVLFGVGAK